MDTQIRLPNDFKEFLKLLTRNKVEYLIVGGYAVGYYGYPRPTGDMDIWVAHSRENAERLVTALNEFGFASPELSTDLFTKAKSIVRMGAPPFKLEIITYIDGVELSRILKDDEQTARVPLIIATAHVVSGDRECFLRQSRADGFVRKPVVEPKELVSLVNQLTSGPRRSALLRSHTLWSPNGLRSLSVLKQPSVRSGAACSR